MLEHTAQARCDVAAHSLSDDDGPSPFALSSATPRTRKQRRPALYDVSGTVKSKAIVAQHDAASEAN
jgi:hypothetical protein